MYKCKDCGMPLTEFDVCFGKNLLKDYDVNKCNCYLCQTRGETQRAFSQHEKYLESIEIYKRLFKRILIAAATISIGLIIFLSAMKYEDFFYRYLELFQIIALPFAIYCMYVLFYLLQCDFDIVSQWYKSTPGGDYEGYHYESTIDSNGTVNTKKVNDYSRGSDNFLSQAFKFITFPYWFVFHFVYVLIRSRNYLKKVCPQQAIYAYKAAHEQTTKYMLSTKERVEYSAKLEKYKRDVENIRNKNRVLGESEVIRLLRDFQMPTYYMHMNNKVFICVEEKTIYRYRNNKDAKLVLYKNDNDEIEYKILIGQADSMYMVFDEQAKIGLQDWRDLGLSKESESNISTLINEFYKV